MAVPNIRHEHMDWTFSRQMRFCKGAKVTLILTMSYEGLTTTYIQTKRKINEVYFSPTLCLSQRLHSEIHLDDKSSQENAQQSDFKETLTAPHLQNISLKETLPVPQLQNISFKEILPVPHPQDINFKETSCSSP